MKSYGALVIGAGPAGLRAAEVLATSGVETCILDHKPSLGRKFLMAGRGGLNITHSESEEVFATRYDTPERWRRMLPRFTPQQARRWYQELGIATFVGTSGRIFPRSVRAPEILERWLERLYRLGCEIRPAHRFHQILGEKPFDVVFQTGDDFALLTGNVIVFALGGASWPQTGSDATWIQQFLSMGVQVNQFTPSNVGWERPLSPDFLQIADGKPLKNLGVRCAGRSVRGELLITRYGLEGGALYQLTRELRQESKIEIDFKPDLTESDLRKRWRGGSSLWEVAAKSWRLSTTAIALLQEIRNPKSLENLVKAVKSCSVKLDQPRPIAEAISSAGGVAWDELDDGMMLRRMPGVFCAGEMIDWDAPTGGYLLQGCMVTGTIAGEEAVNWIARNRHP